MAAQVKRGTVAFEVDGAAMALRVSTNAMATYQEKTGEQFIAALAALSKSPGDIIRLRNLFWAALEGEHSADDVGDIIDGLGMGETVDLIGKAVQAAWPAANGEAGNAKGAKAKAPATLKEPTT